MRSWRRVAVWQSSQRSWHECGSVCNGTRAIWRGSKGYTTGCQGVWEPVEYPLDPLQIGRVPLETRPHSCQDLWLDCKTYTVLQLLTELSPQEIVFNSGPSCRRLFGSLFTVVKVY